MLAMGGGAAPTLYTTQMGNPFVARDCYQPPSPGPGHYTPRYPRGTKGPVLPPPDQATKSRKKPGDHPEVPGPGAYQPRYADSSPCGLRIEPPTKKDVPNPARTIVGPFRKRGQKSMPLVLDTPGPGAYTPRPVRKSPSAPVFDKVGASEKGPGAPSGAADAVQKKPEPGPTTYTPRPPKAPGAVHWSPPAYDPEDAKRRWEAYRAAQNRNRRPWRDPT
eukprot:EG_transcript_19549